MIRRRQFITLLGGAAAWPMWARAQQRERMRRIGILLPAAADDLDFQARVGAFLQELALLGWTIGRNVRIDARWATFNADEIRRHAAELAALAPDVILAFGASTVAALLKVTRSVPIVFPAVVDPVGAGFIDSLARPGGNATGFTSYEYSLAAKWVELLKQIAPNVSRRQSCATSPHLLAPASSASSRLRRRRLGWRSARSTCATPARSSAPLRPSRAPLMAD